MTTTVKKVKPLATDLTDALVAQLEQSPATSFLNLVESLPRRLDACGFGVIIN